MSRPNPLTVNPKMRTLIALLLGLGAVTTVACKSTSQTSEVTNTSEVTLEVSGMT